jgi:hypothetical protein
VAAIVRGALALLEGAGLLRAFLGAGFGHWSFYLTSVERPTCCGINL